MRFTGPAIWGITCLGGFLVLLWVWATAKRQMTYQVGRNCLRVVLGKLTVRRVDFADIERVDKPRRELRWRDTENWRNTFDDSRRLLVIHRKSGWFRKLVITPKHRYAFRRKLREAIAASTGAVLEIDDADETED
jgi:hypothetical protein